LITVVGYIFSQVYEHIFIDMATCLAVNARCASARVLADTFSGLSQHFPVRDQTIQLAKPLGWFSSSEFPKMFKFTVWVTHEV
jgi:hypothetical protein